MAAKNKNLVFTNEIATVLATGFANASYSAVFVLVDNHTKELCLPLITSALPPGYVLIEIPAGESHKNLTTCQHIWQVLTDNQADRHALLVNLGGGVICDMGGFCARTYKRGIHFWNIPTTLLAQVDASVGGKLGIDFGDFKNHIGLFSEPEQVIIDSIFFNTLPANELLSGYAEMVKHALIADSTMFAHLRNEDIHQLDWQKWVPKSVAIKKAIVDQDPREQGLRKILNYGHTIGHAVESYFLNTNSPLKHGEAVAIGMIAENHIAATKGMLRDQDVEMINRFLLASFPGHKIPPSAHEQIIALALQDKKNKNGKIKAVLLNQIGKAVYDIEIDARDIAGSLAYYNQMIK